MQAASDSGCIQHRHVQVQGRDGHVQRGPGHASSGG